MPTVTTFDALLSGFSWNGLSVAGRPTFLTYSFDTSASPAFQGEFSAAFLNSFQPLTAEEQAVARQALRAWADVSGLTLFEAPAGQGDIRFGVYDFKLGSVGVQENLGFAYNPFVLANPDGAWEEDWGGDVFLDRGQATFRVLLHEIGHALGLKHPFEGEIVLDPALDDLAHSVMTYNAVGGAAVSLGLLDVQAVQFLYGPPDAAGTEAANWSWDPVQLVLSQTGDDGDNSLAGVAVADRIDGGAGADYVMARGGADCVAGGAGDDTLAGGDGPDTVDGGPGDDVIDGDNGDDLLLGGDGDDRMWGVSGHDTLDGGAGNDLLVASPDGGRLIGGAGDDILLIAGPGVIVDGGAGFDELWLAPKSSAGLTLSYADLAAGGGSYAGIEAVSLFGDVNADTLQGGALPDKLIGAAGADSLSGGGANDVLFGDDGADTLAGGEGADSLNGGAGDDVIMSGPGADAIDGGPGNDTIDFSAEATGVSAMLNAMRVTPSGVQSMTSVENAIGSGQADSLAGDAGDNRIFGGGGDDTVAGGDGANYLRGDDGNDSLSGGAGFDDINGNAGADTAAGGAGDDWVVGGKDDDLLRGENGDDIVYGNLGDDTCDGGAGADIVRGGQGDDVIQGGAGDDFVSGDKGDDTVTGGAGADLFHTFGEAGVDRVLDFNLAEGDRVMLDPGTVYTVAQVAADTVISMIGGGRMILVGVALDELKPGWIFGN